MTSRNNGERRSFAKALRWSYVLSSGQKGITTILTFVLAALLGPHAFGVVAMAVIFIGFMYLLLEQGVAAALIQRRNLETKHLDSAFWMNLILSLVLALMSIALSSWWAGLNQVPELAPIICVLAAAIPIRGLTIVQEAYLKRQMDFRSLAIRGNVAALGGGLVGLALAFGGAGVWSLVAQVISAQVIGLVLLWKLSAWSPRLVFSWTHLRDLLGFSSGVFANQIGSFLTRRTDVLLMGLFFGPVAVGVYRLAHRLPDTVFSMTTTPVHEVSLAHMSRSQADPIAFQNSVKRIIHASAILTLPALALVWALHPPLIRALGEEWFAASAAVEILCVVFALKCVSRFAGPTLQAAGRPHLQAMITWIGAIASVIGFVIAAWALRGADLESQVAGIALCQLAIVGAVVAPLKIFACHASTSVPWSSMLRPSLSGLGVGVIIVSFSAGLKPLLEGVEANHPIAALVVLSAALGLVAIVAIILLDERVREIVRRRLVKASASQVELRS